MNGSAPIFAVVGHPNKGKSSIVSTLAHDQHIEISGRSGTTTRSHAYKVTTGHGGYTLIDTPGFQRPTKALRWLTKHASNASERSATVARFVNDPSCRQQFVDEVELLTPIVNGAAILYVVDGSKPYGPEYEAEMDILRWTGQPSMALINPIENSRFVDEWKQALGQFFKSVIVFDPFAADFAKQLDLIRTFTHLNSEWQGPLDQVITDLTAKRQVQMQQSVDVLAQLVDDLCQYQVSQKVLSPEQAKLTESALHAQYKLWMKQREEAAIAQLLAVYDHSSTHFSVEQLTLPPDLFDCDQWYMWGLSKRQLASAAAIAGAVSGAAVDLVVAGQSFMLGAIGGSLLGAGSAWFGADKLLNLKLKGLPLGGYQATVGPVKNRNFPYVVIGRFIYVYRQISQLNHADRRPLSFSATDFQNTISQLSKTEQKAVHLACDKLIKQKLIDDLAAVLLPLFVHHSDTTNP